MKFVNKLFALATAVAMVSFSAQEVEAAEYCTDNGGWGYAESRCAPSLAPAIALGTIALVAIIAVALTDSHSSSHHSHE